jgi:cytochrome c peroxidase
MQRGWIVVVAVASVAGGCAELGEDEPLRAPSSGLPSARNSGDDGAEERGRLEVADDPAGKTASYSRNDFDAGPSRALFASLGTNGRTCNSCHLKDQGWTIAAARVRELPGDDPLFAPVDGSDCPPTSTEQTADSASSTLLTGRGVIRIQIAVPAGADFSLASATNPRDCAIPPASPAIGGALFLFRRPLPTANLEFEPAVMWDGRETVQKLTQGNGLTGTDPLEFDLAHQEDDANRGHAQATASIAGTPTVADLLSFETPLYVAQLTLGSLGLDTKGAHGGPRYLGEVVARGFSVGENDPAAAGFTSRVFTLYKAWEPGGSGHVRPHLSDAQKAVGRGEQIFNTRMFTISDVPGLNSAKDDPLANPADPLFDKPTRGTCSTCHNSFDVGSHSTALFLNLGVTRAPRTDQAGQPVAGVLDFGDLPVYTLRSASGATVQVTDPGRALISGLFVDAGKTKVPVLRALPARAPYFHNGSAADLATVVRFYDARFNIGLTAEEERDLVAFLGAL